MIVDNEQACIDVLQRDLACYSNLTIIETLNSQVKASRSIIKKQTDVRCLDVEKPIRTGFELVNDIREDIRTDC